MTDVFISSDDDDDVEEDVDPDELEDEFDEYPQEHPNGHVPRLIHTVPAKEPNMMAVPLKPALKKPKGSGNGAVTVAVSAGSSQPTTSAMRSRDDASSSSR